VDAGGVHPSNDVHSPGMRLEQWMAQEGPYKPSSVAIK
jgi:hypothetical protein